LEVIQPQIPLRLPCYDLTPLADLEFDTPHNGVGLIPDPLSWFDGRCVQGAGTYSPLDGNQRLLGISASRGRVSALDLNYDVGWGLAPTFRCCNPLSTPLYAACSPGDSEHTDLPSPAPSSGSSPAVPL